MDADLRQLVRDRAKNRCEYCHLPQAHHEERFSVDHILPRQHGGTDEESNLALCCMRCNLRKGPNLSGVDSSSGAIVQLFNPRVDAWAEHFRLGAAEILGLTAMGRATVRVLDMNNPVRARLREALVTAGLMPSD